MPLSKLKFLKNERMSCQLDIYVTSCKIWHTNPVEKKDLNSGSFFNQVQFLFFLGLVHDHLA